MFRKRKLALRWLLFHGCYVTHQQSVIRLSSKINRSGRQGLANSYVGLAEILFDEKDFATAEKHLTKAKVLDNYEFSQLLGWKIKRLLDTVKKAKKDSK